MSEPVYQGPKKFGAEIITYEQIGRSKLLISKDVKDRGKSAIRDKNGVTPSDSQFDDAYVMASAAAPLASYHMMVTPTVRNQGSEGSCVSFAAVYYARSIEEYYATGATSFSESVNVFSPEFAFNQVASSNCASSNYFANLDLLKSMGACRISVMPYDWFGCETQPNDEQRADAANFKIASYYTISSSDLVAIKTRLAQNHPIMVQSSVDDAFYYAGPGFFWTSIGQGVGIHAYTIIGYDDSKNAFRVVNSWGSNWGDNGFCWMSYDLLPQVATSVFTMDLAAVAVNQPPIANAGANAAVTVGMTHTLDGTGSTDDDGYIAKYLWNQVSGPNSATLSSPSSARCAVSNLVEGTYIFQLTVTDDKGSVSNDTVALGVNPTVFESVSISATRNQSRGKVFHNLNWNVLLATAPQLVTIEYSVTGTSFSTIHTINPFTATGTFTYQVPKRELRYYRVKVVTNDGGNRYSNTIQIK